MSLFVLDIDVDDRLTWAALCSVIVFLQGQATLCRERMEYNRGILSEGSDSGTVFRVPYPDDHSGGTVHQPAVLLFRNDSEPASFLRTVGEFVQSIPDSDTNEELKPIIGSTGNLLEYFAEYL